MIDLTLLVFVNLCWGTIVMELAISPFDPLMFLWGMVGCSLSVWMIRRLLNRVVADDYRAFIRGVDDRIQKEIVRRKSTR